MKTIDINNLNKEYYNLFCMTDDDMEYNIICIPKDKALTQYIHDDIKQKYATLQNVDDIKKMPCLFINNKKAVFGIIKDIKIQECFIKIKFKNINNVSIEDINNKFNELNIWNSRYRSELDFVHWTIKKVNLMDIIKK